MDNEVDLIRNRHTQIEREVQILHTDVSILKTVSQNLVDGQKQMQHDMKEGFSEL